MSDECSNNGYAPSIASVKSNMHAKAKGAKPVTKKGVAENPRKGKFDMSSNTSVLTKEINESD